MAKCTYDSTIVVGTHMDCISGKLSGFSINKANYICYEYTCISYTCIHKYILYI